MKVELTNTTKKLCVIGDPVLHSKSPLIHNTILGHLELDYLYLCQPVPRGGCAQWLEAAKVAGYAGFNATMPHKEELLPLMDALDEDAKLYGAVNTVAIQEGKVTGYNTDGRGFVRNLEDANFTPRGKRVVILGAGGAAKAVALKLIQQEVAEVTVCNRTPDKAEALCEFDPQRMTAADFSPETLARVSTRADLLVNCTSMGMAGTNLEFADFSFLTELPPHALVCDLIYHPACTQLLERASARGLATLNGLGMLLYQAIFALEYMTGVTMDATALAKVVKPVL